jgi:replication factor A1
VDTQGAEPLEKRIQLSSIRENGLGQGEKGDYVSFKATVNYIRHEQDTWYTACPAEGCNKKVIEMGGFYRCEKCNREFPEVSSNNDNPYRSFLNIDTNMFCSVISAIS